MKNTDSIFQYRNYKEYLLHVIAGKAKKGWGVRSLLAKTIRCETPYVSQVLNGTSHFSLEQAFLISRFFKLPKEEEHFFVLLVQWARAGNEELKEYFDEQLKEILSKRLVLKDRLQVKRTLSAEGQTTYYSAWYYAAIHVALSVPGLHTIAGLSKAFGLSQNRVKEILDFLEDHDLVVQDKEGFKTGIGKIHLAGDSPMISKHHTNWRIKAIQSVENIIGPDLHYSSVVTLSVSDAKKIKAQLIDAIETVKKVIRDSRDEAVYSFDLDFFGLT